jgi:hypothetical protein
MARLFGGSVWRVCLAGQFGTFIWRVFISNEEGYAVQQEKEKKSERM